MPYAVVGVDHTICPISVREPMVLDNQSGIGFLEELKRHRGVEEAVLLSTCARTEVYLWTEGDSDRPRQVATGVLARMNPACLDFIVHRDDSSAVRHAFRVTSGLESQVLGEFEITGQVRAAIQMARMQGSLGTRLDSLFQAAVACSRRLRRETSLGKVEASAAATAAHIYRADHELAKSAVLVVGSGRVARMMASEFHGAHRLVVAARTPSRARALADRLGVESMELSQAIGHLSEFEVACFATRSRRPLLGKREVEAAAPLVIFDVSIPRNVEPEVGEIDGVTLHNVDAVTSTGAPSDPAGSNLVESVLESEVHDFVSRESYREVAPIIAALRAHVDQVRQQELERLRTRLDSFDPSQRSAVEVLTQRLIDRMFHHLVIRLKLASLTDPELIKAADFFFAHGDDTVFPSVVEQPLDTVVAISDVPGSR